MMLKPFPILYLWKTLIFKKINCFLHDLYSWKLNSYTEVTHQCRKPQCFLFIQTNVIYTHNFSQKLINLFPIILIFITGGWRRLFLWSRERKNEIFLFIITKNKHAKLMNTGFLEILSCFLQPTKWLN